MNIEFGPPWLGSGLVFGVICALLASNRGRSGLAWFVLGIFLNCFALILLLALPDLRVEELRDHELKTENRRLREQMRKLRHTTQQHHEVTQKRLDVHDRELQIDTAHLLEENAAGASSPQLAGATLPPLAQALWFYLVEREQIGPVEFDQLRAGWRDGVIDTATYVWCDGMADWQRLRDLPELEAAFRA